VWHSRVWEAEAREATGDYDGAAALYKANIEEMELMASPLPPDLQETFVADLLEQEMATAPALLPVNMSFLGLALKRAGAYGEAEVAYKAALSVVGRSRGVVAAEERESMRITLVKLLLALYDASDEAHKHTLAYAALFKPAIDALCTQQGSVDANFGCEGQDRYYFVDAVSGRRFAVRESADACSDVTGDPHSFIAEVPSGATRRSGGGRVVDPVQRPLRELAQAERLPRVTHTVCAACGARGEAQKRCGACLQLTYCSVACQRAHWKAHKAECKRAVEAAKNAKS
jgi:tetratricopeptide (TPR) repeat protein